MQTHELDAQGTELFERVDELPKPSRKAIVPPNYHCIYLPSPAVSQ
ncbi:MAG TPA: hypothetical protein VMZ30_17675 [Pyrinomonadaceae bacterium]|nr:hypothetical protein [Pyrinomonadaceae bacterium]